jgi:methyl coenzyme M reductase subunit C-like uncharacterized protein (methanogenesis marker protein 7)
MAKDKKTQRSNKTLPNDWTPSGKIGREENRRKHAEEIRAMKHYNLSRNR